ncbi:YdeI/OmpD-associated family protein [Shewanella sp. 10N.286.48.B5]|uniref:YdeI/OmpD-associated family protein n=1 Tax=Shewanella sp. 10N.286.48.B5 TaxID=1880834 RepID=UPI000C83858C|nr:YdeI/OmpD-associated family protein [Shewanella sp. 10N.286.48.B5]PMH87002.1 hypothetical protein BCU57_08365 [Shewanella sp. 10N.286.48.B5]
MPEPKLFNTVSFEVSQDLGQWLKLNHASENELWIKLYKKSSGIKSITWDDVVIESLCWGWIDGVKKSLDEQSYIQRITPRKARSNWSKRNTKHAESLINENRMMEPGLVHIRAAKADGRWENAYVVSEMEVPLDFIASLDSNLQAKEFYETLTKSSRYAIAYGLISAKKPETRLRRFTKFMEMLINEQKP